ncbi:MAG: nuclear transport factor 2 family protein [Actinomycetota bacterium]|nr:nuclear transport factor 2 family protein [Actinomycetota bacterium]
MRTENETVVAQMFTAYNERRWEDFAAGYAPDAIVSYPQSGERIVGRENILRMVEAFPSPPRFTLTEMHSSGDLVVAEADADYGDGMTWKAAVIYSVAGGNIASETAYFGAPFEPAEWRAPFVS